MIRPNTIAASTQPWDAFANPALGRLIESYDPPSFRRPIHVVAEPPKPVPAPPKITAPKPTPPIIAHKPAPRIISVVARKPPVHPKAPPPPSKTPAPSTMDYLYCPGSGLQPYGVTTCPPISCPQGQTLQNGVCAAPGTVVCPQGEYPVAGVCVPVPVPCPGGFVDADGNCIQSGAPTPINGTCPPSYALDSAGNCVSVQTDRNPYSLYLPTSDTTTGSPAATTPAATGCPTGEFADSSGNCFPDTLMGWLQASTLWAGRPNYEVVGGVLGIGAVLFLAMRSGKSGKKASR